MSVAEFQSAIPKPVSRDRRIALLCQIAEQMTGLQELRATDLDIRSQTLMTLFNQLHKDRQKQTRLLFASGSCYLNGEYLRLDQNDSETVTELQHLLRLRGLGGFSLKSQVSQSDVLAVLKVFAKPPPQGDRQQRMGAVQQNLETIHEELSLEEIKLELIAEGSAQNLISDRSVVLPPTAKKASLCFARLLSRTRLALDCLAKGEDSRHWVSGIERVLHNIIDEIDNSVFRSRLLAWTYLRGVELQIVHHNVSKAVLVICAGRELGFEPVRLASLAMAAVLHDMIRPADQSSDHEVWTETVRCGLSTDSFSRQQLYRMILPYEQLGLHVLDLKPLDGQEPLFESQLLAVTCAFDRLTRDEWMPPAHALRQITSDKRFHRGATAALVATLGVLPRGSVIRLSDGYLAVVLENGRHRLHRPLVRLLQRKDGSMISDYHFVDLTDPESPGIEGAVDERNLAIHVMEAVIEGTTDELEEE